MCCKELIKELGVPVECVSNSHVASENGKRLELQLTKGARACKVKVDGCVIKSQSIQKCDFLFKICQTNKFYFVELKGGDVMEAVHQIISTIQELEKKSKLKITNYEGIIVSTSVPRATESRFRKLQEKAIKEHGLKIIKAHNSFKLPV